MRQEYIIKTPFTKSHSHFYDYIEDFPQLHEHHDDHHESALPANEQMLDHLRLELKNYALNPNYYQARLCFKKCFKLWDRDYVEYCLQKNCGAEFQDAAKFLGWAK